jgi:signal peptidase I
MTIAKNILFLLHCDGKCSISVSGACMEPWLSDGDEVTVYSYQTKIMVGDIVLINNNEKLQIHRVIQISDDGICTKGDQAVMLDSKIRYKDVLGYAVSVRKYQPLQKLLICRLVKLSLKMHQVYVKTGKIDLVEKIKIKVIKVSNKIISRSTL